MTANVFTPTAPMWMQRTRSAYAHLVMRITDNRVEFWCGVEGTKGPGGDLRIASMHAKRCTTCPQYEKNSQASESHTVGMDRPTPENDPIGRFRRTVNSEYDDAIGIEATETLERLVMYPATAKFRNDKAAMEQDHDYLARTLQRIYNMGVQEGTRRTENVYRKDRQ
jgi:hypothetical protein